MSVSTIPDNHAALHAGFRWLVPERFNIAQVCCARWAQRPDAAQRVAVRNHAPGSAAWSYSYAELQDGANRLSALLRRQGVARGDRVAIVLPQRFETAVAYVAVLQMGAVAMPLSTLFGPEALEYRLQDSAAVVAICDHSAIASLREVRGRCPQLRCVIGLEAAGALADLDYAAATGRENPAAALVQTAGAEAAILISPAAPPATPRARCCRTGR